MWGLVPGQRGVGSLIWSGSGLVREWSGQRGRGGRCLVRASDPPPPSGIHPTPSDQAGIHPRNKHVVRDGLHCHQCNCSHMSQIIHRCLKCERILTPSLKTELRFGVKRNARRESNGTVRNNAEYSEVTV